MILFVIFSNNFAWFDMLCIAKKTIYGIDLIQFNEKSENKTKTKVYLQSLSSQFHSRNLNLALFISVHSNLILVEDANWRKNCEMSNS